MGKIIQVDLYNNNHSYINFSTDWLNIEDYQVKILMLVSELEDNDLAFNGNLKTMCEWLGINPTPNNNKNIKEAIENLSNNNYIEYSCKGQKYIITITSKGMEDNKIIKLRKCWLETFKNYKQQGIKGSISWIKLLKVFVYVCSEEKKFFYTQEEIAENLNVCVRTVGTALKVLTQCNLQDISFKKEIEKKEIKDYKGKVIKRKNKGTNLYIGIEFE